MPSALFVPGHSDNALPYHGRWLLRRGSLARFVGPPLPVPAGEE